MTSLPALPARITLAPGCDLTLMDVVAVARGSSEGHYAEVVLGGDWRDRCERSAEYVRHLLDATQGKDDTALAQLVREQFSAAPPASIAELLAAPPDHAAASRALAARALVYGVTTGFGNNKDKPLRTRDEARRMQLNLLRSHAAGVGPPAPTEVVRATLLLRIRSFVEGHSGVRPQLVELLCAMLNARIHPWVPQQGSVGSSGDLCPLSHLFLSVVGEGVGWRQESDGINDDREPAPQTCGETASPLQNSESQGSAPEFPRSRHVPQVRATTLAAACKSEPHAIPAISGGIRDPRRGDPRPVRDLLREAGIRPLDHLEPKEGLALTNGTTFTTAYAALACYDAAVLLDTANLSAAMSLQALKGCTRAFDPRVHRVRRHAGQAQAASGILSLARGGELLDASDDVQDAYSLRCAPQVHGAAATAIRHASEVVEQEINAVTDNPLLLLDDGGCPAEERTPPDGFGKCIWRAYSAGNFHGEPVGMVMDYLKIAVAELASISERRTQHLLDRHHNRGLPANLAPGAAGGLNSGLMIAQYTAASLVSENKVLAHPASVDSIPTSANAEDHVAMAPIAARHARQVIENACNVLAIEVLCAAQALTIRLAQGAARPPRLSDAAQAVLNLIRATDGIAPQAALLDDEDEVLWPKIASLRRRIAAGDLADIACRAWG
ncbi:MAG: histidine ammonia-lyase [Phycisphaerales bacterium]|nr:histidine ammonia-lyase [Phycisphaerales bacterium]